MNAPDAPKEPFAVIVGRCEYRLAGDRLGVQHRLVGNHTYLARDPLHPSPDEKIAFKKLLVLEESSK
jgi:hypothetical protein